MLFSNKKYRLDVTEPVFHPYCWNFAVLSLLFFWSDKLTREISVFMTSHWFNTFKVLSWHCTSVICSCTSSFALEKGKNELKEFLFDLSLLVLFDLFVLFWFVGSLFHSFVSVFFPLSLLLFDLHRFIRSFLFFSCLCFFPFFSFFSFLTYNFVNSISVRLTTL